MPEGDLEFAIKPKVDFSSLDQQLQQVKSRLDKVTSTAGKINPAAAGFGNMGGTGIYTTGGARYSPVTGGGAVGGNNLNSAIASLSNALNGLSKQITSITQQLGGRGGSGGVGGVGGGTGRGVGGAGGVGGLGGLLNSASTAKLVGGTVGAAVVTMASAYQDHYNREADFAESTRYGGASNFYGSQMAYNKSVSLGALGDDSLKFLGITNRTPAEANRILREADNAHELGNQNFFNEQTTRSQNRRVAALGLASPFARQRENLSAASDDKITAAHRELVAQEDRYGVIDVNGKRVDPESPALRAELGRARSIYDQRVADAKAEASGQYALLNRDALRSQRVESFGLEGAASASYYRAVGNQIGAINVTTRARLSEFDATRDQKFNMNDMGQRAEADRQRGFITDQGEADKAAVYRQRNVADVRYRASTSSNLMRYNGNSYKADLSDIDAAKTAAIRDASDAGQSPAEIDNIRKYYNSQTLVAQRQRSRLENLTNISLDGQLAAQNLYNTGAKSSAANLTATNSTINQLYGVDTGDEGYNKTLRRRVATLGVAELRGRQRDLIQELATGSAVGVANGISLDAMRENGFEAAASNDKAYAATGGIDAAIKQINDTLAELNGKGAGAPVADMVAEFGKLQGISNITDILKLLQGVVQSSGN